MPWLSRGTANKPTIFTFGYSNNKGWIDSKATILSLDKRVAPTMMTLVMKLNLLNGLVFLCPALVVLSSCKPSAPPPPSAQKNVTADMTAYASAVIDEFYDYDLEAVIARSKDKLSIDLLESFADNAHETAAPAKKVKHAHHYSQDNGVTLVSLEYAIPNEVGQEKAIVILSYDNEECCELMGFDLK